MVRREASPLESENEGAVGIPYKFADPTVAPVAVADLIHQKHSLYLGQGHSDLQNAIIFA